LYAEDAASFVSDASEMSILFSCECIVGRVREFLCVFHSSGDLCRVVLETILLFLLVHTYYVPLKEKPMNSVSTSTGLGFDQLPFLWLTPTPFFFFCEVFFFRRRFSLYAESFFDPSLFVSTESLQSCI
jgi:hypothetical protein